MPREALLVALIIAAAPGLYDSILKRSSKKDAQRVEARERGSPTKKVKNGF